MPRKTKFIEPIKNQIIQAISQGATYQVAAECASITEATLYNWIRKGNKQASGDFRLFVDKLKQAEAQSAMGALQCIQTNIANGNLKAAFFLLERRHNYKREERHVRANQITDQPKQQQQEISIAKELQDQAADLRKAIKSAAKSESWQAYAALNRQLLQTISQIQHAQAETGQIDKMDAYSDEQLLNEITNVIFALPPLARQRIQEELGLLTNNVIPISK